LKKTDAIIVFGKAASEKLGRRRNSLGFSARLQEVELHGDEAVVWFGHQASAALPVNIEAPRYSQLHFQNHDFHRLAQCPG
jgi:hypothetical protein